MFKALALTGNVIVVNVNYRVGPFGYLYMDHEDAPGNMGMLDQQMALYWIRDNIFNFGGNPSRMTVFGESAGAASIVAHLIAPASKGLDTDIFLELFLLFRNGILQSGSLDNKWSMDTPKRAKDKANQLATLVGCNRTEVKETIACLRNVPAVQLVENIWSLDLAFLEFPFVIVSRLFHEGLFETCISLLIICFRDRNFFRHKDGFSSLRTGQYSHNVNLMFGINHDEGNFWNIYNLADYFDKTEQPELNRHEFFDCVERAFSTQPDLVRSAAKFVYSDPNCTDPNQRTQFYAEQVNQMVGDYFFTCDSLWLADQIPGSGHAGRIYIYYFDQPSSANPWPKWTGVMHGYEIEYVFGVPIYNETAGYTKREQILAEKIMQYWSSFATTGYGINNMNYIFKLKHNSQLCRVPRLKDGKASDMWPEYDGVNKTK
uniref:Carboxylic ester hydrolase n=1 Tax=Heterorhabditis bacteriophora TaxID=37862 RepID=A0A1I7XSY7_HETBA